jgi:hypothetical protein
MVKESELKAALPPGTYIEILEHALEGFGSSTTAATTAGTIKKKTKKSEVAPSSTYDVVAPFLLPNKKGGKFLPLTVVWNRTYMDSEWTHTKLKYDEDLPDLIMCLGQEAFYGTLQNVRVLQPAGREDDGSGTAGTAATAAARAAAKAAAEKEGEDVAGGSGCPAPLFAVTDAMRKSTLDAAESESESDDATDAEAECKAELTPLVELEHVEVGSGEENEDILFEAGLALFTCRYFAVQKTVQLMTASTVHVNNRTPGSECNPRSRPSPLVRTASSRGSGRSAASGPSSSSSTRWDGAVHVECS